MFAQGTWSLTSKIDPRWNARGEGLVGNFVCPPECQNQVDLFRMQFGEPPADLEYEYMKD